MIKSIFQDIKSINKRGSFIQNFAFISFSKLLIALGGFLFTPILSRIYNPDAYGSFAVFNAYVSLSITIATMSFPSAFVLPKKNAEFENLLILTLFFACITSICCVPLFSFNLLGLSDVELLGGFKHFVAFGTFIGALSSILGFWIIREKEFRSSSLRSIVVSYSSKGFNVGYGLLTNGLWSGIILTHLVSGVLSIVNSVMILKKSIRSLSLNISFAGLYDSFIKYKNYPFFVLPTTLISSVTAHLPIIFISESLGKAQVGYLTFAISLLDIPIRLLGESAIGPVLLQKAASLRNESFDSKVLYFFRKVYLSLTLASVPIFSVVIFFGPTLFSILFGSKWQFSGEISQVLCIYSMVRLIGTPNSTILRILELEKYLMVSTLLHLFVAFSATLIAIRYSNLLYYVWIFSIGASMVILFMGYFYYRLLIKRLNQIHES